MSPGPQTWWKAVLAYPPTWAAGAFLSVLTVGFVAVLDPGAFMTVGLLVVVAVAAAGWPLAMSVTGELSKRQFATQDTSAADATKTAELAAELRGLSDSQPKEQLVALVRKREALLKILDRRLDRGELTYTRYASTAQQVFDSALHNLHEVVVAHDSVTSIDANYINRRLAELDRDGVDSESVQRERETLAQRAQLREVQVARIGRLLAQNEAALTTLDRTTSALADVPVGQRPEEADDAMAALDELADRARMYAIGDGT